MDVRRKFVEDDMLGRGGVYPAEMSMIWDGGCRWNGRWRFSFSPLMCLAMRDNEIPIMTFCVCQGAVSSLLMMSFSPS